MNEGLYSQLKEEELYGQLTHVLTGSSKDHNYRRLNCLEELRARIESRSIKNVNDSVSVLLEVAKSHGGNQPENSLIVESLSLLAENYEGAFDRLISGLVGQEGQLFIVFSRLAPKLSYERKTRAVQPLMQYIVTSEVVNDIGVAEVYACLLDLGDQKLGSVIANQASNYLNALEPCAIIHSVGLCSRFADHRLLPQMLKVLERSTDDFFGAYSVQIERDLCAFFERTKDESCLIPLMDLLKKRFDQGYSHISRAIGSVLDAHSYRIDDVLDMLFDARGNKKLVDAILCSLDETHVAINAVKLLSKMSTRYWFDHPAGQYMSRILVRGGESSKPALFEMLRDDERYDFALACLKEIGVSAEELSGVFQKPLLLRIYDYLYLQAKRKKMPSTLKALWDERNKLGENVPGTTDKLEHLLLHILSSYYFVTLNVAPLGLESVDVIGFYPASLDILFVGCTTGVLNSDLEKLDALIKKMEEEMPDLFKTCTVTPVIVASKDMTIHSSDLKYAAEQSIAILQNADIDRLLEMLVTSRDAKQALQYIKEHIPMVGL